MRVPLDDVLLGAPGRGIGLLALDEALDSLSRIDARKSRVVEMRYFGGLSVDETAEFLRNLARNGQARLESGQSVVVWSADR